MAIGMGSGSVLSRALGAKNQKSKVTFAKNYDDLFWRHFCAMGIF
jgi:hypothetical protein